MMNELINGNVYLCNPQSAKILNDFTIISDTDTNYNIKTNNYVLEFTDGERTLPLFKKLISDGNFGVIVIFVENFELFNECFSVFRHYDFIYLTLPTVKHKNKHYINYEQKIRKINKLPCNNRIIAKAYDLSYKPDVSNSVLTSLIKPELYLNKNNCPEKIIIKALMDGPKTYDEICKLCNNSVDIYIKSLMFADIIKKKNDMFCLKIFC